MQMLLTKFFLNALTFPYRTFNYLRRFFVTGKKAPIPVISIGNLSYGGTGKTPLTVNIAKFLLNKGYKVAIGIRGYRGEMEKRGKYYPPGEKVSAGEAGDEAAVIKLLLPETGLFVGKDRVAGALRAAQEGFDLFLMDDGFQYLSLKKDFNIVLHSEKIPTFYLREILPALKFADVIVLPEGEEIGKNWNVPIFHIKFRSNAKEFEGKEVFSFCGIAKPERFVESLTGLRLKGYLFFPDHHSYSPLDLDKIYRGSEGALILTTLKDYGKIKELPNFRSDRIRFLTWEAEILEEEFYQLLLKSLEKRNA